MISSFQKIGAAFPSEETVIETEFTVAAARGAWAMMVKAETQEQRATAVSILRAHHGNGLRYYGDRVITDL